MTQNRDKLRYEDLSFPTYKNSREIGLEDFTIEDLVRAAIVSGTNVLLTGEAGDGKSQLMYDIANYWFGGSEGDSVVIRAHPEVDLYNELFKRLNIHTANIELVERSVNAAFYGVDELNRAPEVAQNQFFGLGDGIIEFKGKAYKIGKDIGNNKRYAVMMATCNLEDGEYTGTFDIDKALRDRIPLVIEVTHPHLRTPNEDEIDILKDSVYSQVKFKEKRNITSKIINAYKEIIEASKNYPIEGLAVLYYLKEGLRQCRRNNDEKYRGFPIDCQDCDEKGNICYMIKPTSMRVLQALKQLSLGLAYIGMLKESEDHIKEFERNIADYLFAIYPFVANGKKLVNPLVLRYDFKNDEFYMLKEIAGVLKDEYKKKEDYLLTSLYYAIKDGKIVSSFYVHEDSHGKKKLIIYDEDDKYYTKYSLINPFEDTKDLKWSWVHDNFLPKIIEWTKYNKK